ncbi:iron-containing redox enzyme family protein [Nocardia thailandica]|uniref:Iron-containing redox enzyme family protein n=1 Tax=Nocardia thailandica TaxID=257275 RepID=A0ABW6PU39_9NOCA
MTAAAVALRALPTPRGDLSAATTEVLRRPPGSPLPAVPPGRDCDEDLLLALHTCYELHYHGFADVDEAWEWDPGLLAWRAALEAVLLDDLRGNVAGGTDVHGELDRLLSAPRDQPDIAGFLGEEGTPDQLREYFVHRSIYHHIEADPYAWVIPRLRGEAKAALVAVEYDEFGAGRGERVHARLYADLLTGAGLDPGYLRYLDAVGAPMLALVDMMSLFGLHRARRAATVGHFASVEISSSPASRRLVEVIRELLPHPDCVRFYTEHVEADAVHEQVMRHGVLDSLLAEDPAHAEGIVFGIQATDLLESRFTDHVLHAWRHGRSSLRAPLSPDAEGS